MYIHPNVHSSIIYHWLDIEATNLGAPSQKKKKKKKKNNKNNQKKTKRQKNRKKKLHPKIYKKTYYPTGKKKKKQVGVPPPKKKKKKKKEATKVSISGWIGRSTGKYHGVDMYATQPQEENETLPFAATWMELEALC